MRTKYLVFACGIAVFAAVLLGGFNYYWVRKLTLERAYDNLSDSARLIAPQVKAGYDRMRNDAVAVSQMPPFQGLIRATYNVGIDPVDASTMEQWQDRLKVIFASILRHRPSYVQMRFISMIAGGQELVRTDQRDGRIYNIPDTALQKKGDSSYLLEATAMPADGVYYSKVTPNVDFGKIDFDLQVLRVVTQVRDDGRNLFGFMVINADYVKQVQDLLAQIQTVGDIYIVNSNGGYVRRAADGTVSPLMHPGQINYRLPHLDPARAGDGAPGRIVRDGGMLVSQAIVKFDSASGPGSSATVILAVPEVEVLAQANETRSQVLALSAGLVVLAFLLAYLAADRLTRPMHGAVTAINAYRPGGADLVLPTGRRDEIGDLSRAFVGLLTLLSDSQRAQQDMLARLEAILNYSVDGLIAMDDQGMVRHYSPGAAAIFGYPPEEVIGRNIKMLMQPSDQVLQDSFLAEYQATGQSKLIGSTREVLGQARDGRLLPLELSISEVRIGEERLFSGIVRDISERKEMAQRLEQQAERLQRSNQDLEDFAYIASHDLKEPLRAISNHVQFLSEDCGDQIDEDSRNRIVRIQTLCKKAEKLISELLHFSRLGRANIENDSVDIEGIVQEIRENLSDSLEERNAAIDMTSPLPPVQGDKSRLMSLFHNLIVNGIKYNDSPSKCIRIGFDPERRCEGGGRGAYFVQDNGIGVPEEFKDAIFKIFKRLHNEKAYGPGTGAGLSFARKIVERHGGRLWLEAAPGGGTTFFFDLPRADQ